MRTWLGVRLDVSGRITPSFVPPYIACNLRNIRQDAGIIEMSLLHLYEGTSFQRRGIGWLCAGLED
jgi:hypothetical protein